MRRSNFTIGPLLSRSPAAIGWGGWRRCKRTETGTSGGLRSLRRTMAANPGDFDVRLLLTRVLLDSGRQADAENELRQAVELSKNDPVRWITLVKILAETKQPDKAEKAFKEAKTNLAQLTEPTPSLAFAECCELVGRGYESVGSADAVKTWYGEAKSWLEKAQRAQPNNLSITRRLTQFLLQTKQSNEAESLLEAILKRGSSDNKTADEVAWARRALALTRIAKGDPEQARKALALFDATDQTVRQTRHSRKRRMRGPWLECSTRKRLLSIASGQSRS